MLRYSQIVLWASGVTAVLSVVIVLVSNILSRPPQRFEGSPASPEGLVAAPVDDQNRQVSVLGDVRQYENAEAGFRFQYPSRWGAVEVERIAPQALPREPEVIGNAIEIRFSQYPNVIVEAATSDYWAYAGYTAYRGGTVLGEVCTRPGQIEKKDVQAFPRSRYSAFGYCKVLTPHSYYETIMSSLPEGDPQVFIVEQTAYFNLKRGAFVTLAIISILSPEVIPVVLPKTSESVARKQLEPILRRTAPKQMLDAVDEFEGFVSSVRIL